MRGFVKNTLSDLMKQPAVRSPQAPVARAPRPPGNRKQRRAQQSVMNGVQKQLARQGIKMELGPNLDELKEPEVVAVQGRQAGVAAVVSDELEEMVEDFKKSAT